MIITIESWRCTTEETLIEIDAEIKSIKERIEEIIKKRLAK